MELLTRDDFREAVFTRDGNVCIVCRERGNPDHPELPPRVAKDAHHIIERRLFPDGGYYLDNGASVCEVHHLQAEQTFISCDELRTFAGITQIVLPPDFYSDQEYDKWGNPFLVNGMRARGPLYYDESVQKVLALSLHAFTKYVKHPRTYHLPWSLGMTDDDRMMESLDGFKNESIIMTEKMDGEQTTMYNDHIHARSIDSSAHPSRSWVKNLWSKIAFEIPEDMRICGENLFAKHSIAYEELPSFFLVHSIWERDRCLSWEQTVEWCELLGLTPVPVLVNPLNLEVDITALVDWNVPADKEGYVVRVARSFGLVEYPRVVGKFVRANHVQTHGHWMRSKLEPNKLASIAVT